MGVTGELLAERDNVLRKEALFFAVSIQMAVVAPKCTILGSYAEDGTLAAIAICQLLHHPPPKDPSFGDLMRIMMDLLRCIVRGKFPQLFRGFLAKGKANRELGRKWRPGFFKRFDAMDNLMHEMHVENADFPHLYVAVVATNPLFQGKGHGSRLLRAIARVADAA